MKGKVVLLDVAKIDVIVKHAGIQGLDAVLKRGDFLFFSDDAQKELRGGAWYKKAENKELIHDWLRKQRKAGRIVGAEDVIDKEKQKYDPNNRRGTSKGGAELWDMSARKFMAENPDYEYEVISADKKFFENRDKNKWNAEKRDHEKIVDVPFRKTSLKNFMAELVVDPDVNLTKEQFKNIQSLYVNNGFGNNVGLKIEGRKFPSDYEHSQLLKIGKRFRRLYRTGAPVLVLGIAAVPVLSTIQAHAEEKNITFAQAVGELELGISEEQLTSLAADVGIDVAVSLTPIGALKKAWDVLGNIDDIIAVTELYGAAYRDNQVIQEMAGVARAVKGSAAFNAYVEGRDALTGAVGGAIDWITGSGESEEEIAASLGNLQTVLDASEEEIGEAMRSGASQEELSRTLMQNTEAWRRKKEAGEQVLLDSQPVENVDELVHPRQAGADLSPHLQMPAGTKQPAQEMPLLSGAARILPSGLSPTPGAEIEPPGEGSVQPQGDGSQGPGSEDPLTRKTSYDAVKKLGATPEEEAQAVAEFNALLEQSYVDMLGDEEASDALAVSRFSRAWGPSAMAPYEAGTIIKHSAEKTYPDHEKDGHGYVRREAEAMLAQRGQNADAWYLVPNEKTGADKAKGQTDQDGYGPRMTLLYDDEAGARHVLTDSFQAHVGGAFQRRGQAQRTRDLETAQRFGIEVPSSVLEATAARPPVPRAKPEAATAR